MLAAETKVNCTGTFQLPLAHLTRFWASLTCSISLAQSVEVSMCWVIIHFPGWQSYSDWCHISLLLCMIRATSVFLMDKRSSSSNIMRWCGNRKLLSHMITSDLDETPVLQCWTAIVCTNKQYPGVSHVWLCSNTLLLSMKQCVRTRHSVIEAVYWQNYRSWLIQVRASCNMTCDAGMVGTESTVLAVTYMHAWRAHIWTMSLIHTKLPETHLVF